MSKVTLKQIAEATGFAQNTVSRVINKKPYYSSEVEKKILKAVAELGYIGNNVAASLKSGKSKTIAVVYDDFVNPYYNVMTDIIARKFAESNYDIMIFSNYGASPFLSLALTRKILYRKVDGILSFLQPDFEARELIKKHNIPIVVLGRDSKNYDIDSICGNDEEGGRIATEHLISKGFRRIAYVGADPSISVDIERYKGYLNALKIHNLPFEENAVFYLRDYGNADRVVDPIIERGLRAIFCFNDNFSFGILRALERRGYKLPADFSLVGYDNLQEFLHLPHFLTTVGADNEKMAEAATNVLLGKIENLARKQFKDYFSVTLIQGQTT
jgi:Transcriptional regulators